ncbi:MAG TPA: transporter [Terriglobales bacterium]
MAERAAGETDERRRARRLRLTAILATLVVGLPLCAQDLSPRAYLITPVHANAITLTWSFYDGGVNFNGTIPITGATGAYHVPVVSLYHSLHCFGRSANITVALPYGIGTFQGDAFGTQQSVYRSGLLDLTVRFSVNLIGGPAMPIDEFVKWKQKTLVGVSVKVLAPTGQYDGTKLVNWGINRWAFKPELGYSRRWGKWILDAYGGAWLFTTNNAFFDTPVPRPQTEGPLGSFEGHLSREFKSKRCWASLDGNYWFGGTTALNGIINPSTRQTSSRLGGTFAVPVTKHQSLKFAFSDGTFIRFGGNYHNLQVAWQYSWIGRPE